MLVPESKVDVIKVTCCWLPIWLS